MHGHLERGRVIMLQIKFYYNQPCLKTTYFDLLNCLVWVWRVHKRRTEELFRKTKTFIFVFKSVINTWYTCQRSRFRFATKNSTINTNSAQTIDILIVLYNFPWFLEMTVQISLKWQRTKGGQKVFN